MLDDDLDENDCGGTPAMPDVASAAAWAARRDMVNVPIRMATLRAVHGTWPANKAHADAALWHYGTRAIAGDYGI